MAIKIKSKEKIDIKNINPAPTPTEEPEKLEEETGPRNAKEALEEIKNNKKDYKILSPMKAIRANCLDCCGGSEAEVRRCHINTCPLHPFRFGKNPFNKRGKRNYTEEEKKAIGDRLKKAREAPNNA